MKITSSQVDMASDRLFTRQEEVSQKLTVRVDGAAVRTGGTQAPSGTKLEAASSTGKPSLELTDEELLANNPRLLLIRRIVEALTGRKITLSLPRIGTGCDDETAKAGSAGEQQATGRAGWSVEYDYRERRSEEETTTFSARGVVKTADGRELRFQADLVMSRSFVEETGISIRAGDAARKDPLVITFEGTAAQLTEGAREFDIDADGTPDSIHVPTAGSGFLALDLNVNGRIDDGSELFGPATGDGFSELRAWDEDGNGWIDEGDRVFARLTVWSANEEGEGRLWTLGELKIGAIFTGSARTAFSIKDAAQATVGEVVGTGLYLREDGEAGTVQQVDLMT